MNLVFLKAYQQMCLLASQLIMNIREMRKILHLNVEVNSKEEN